MLFDETCEGFCTEVNCCNFLSLLLFQKFGVIFTICGRTFAKQTSTVLTFSALFYLIPQLAMYKLVIKVYNNFKVYLLM